MKKKFLNKRLRADALDLIAQANDIIEEYQGQGYDLTLRQLFYQFVARDLFANTQKNYTRLGNVISDGRLAGLVDWDAIEDRLRVVSSRTDWKTPKDILTGAANSYHIDLWKGQMRRVQVWIEKDALLGIIENVCFRWDVPYLACRGYASQTALYKAGRAIKEAWDNDQGTVILHLGDHDPSGIDMTRDLQERLMLLSGMSPVIVQRIALNMSQVEQYDPPPNPARLTDPRADAYIGEFGNTSWELDALEPNVIVELIEEHIDQLVDLDAFNARKAEKEAQKAELKKIADNYDRVVQFLKKTKKTK